MSETRCYHGAVLAAAKPLSPARVGWLVQVEWGSLQC